MRDGKRRSPLFWALWLSLIVHAVLLTLYFKPALKKFTDQLPALEVMLVNSQSLTRPKKADALAQVNLDRGGNTDEKRQLKSPLPVTQQLASIAQNAAFQATQVDLQAQAAQQTQETELAQEKQRVAKLEQEAQALLTRLRSEHFAPTLQTLPNQQTAATQRLPQPVKPEDAMQTKTMQEMAKLEALIAKQQEEYESRPKRQFIGARTQEYRFASYVEQWRQKVENIGNLNYPEVAKTQKLYGQLQMTVSIRADGSIEAIVINHSSGHKLLDESAKRIVRLAAPFNAFPLDIRRDTDILSITRTWSFTRQETLMTE